MQAKEMSDVEKFLDRWNTRGGAILACVLLLVLGWGMEKFFELIGLPELQAGLWTSGIFSVALLYWTFTYLFRVTNKQTTYANQLATYEREVMMRRLKELDDEEIAALCEEVGITKEDISLAMGDPEKAKALTQKDQVLELFKNTKMPKSEDPRDFFARR